MTSKTCHGQRGPRTGPCAEPRGAGHAAVLAAQRAPGVSHLEGKLVHGVDPAQVVHDEVE